MANVKASYKLFVLILLILMSLLIVYPVQAMAKDSTPQLDNYAIANQEAVANQKAEGKLPEFISSSIPDDATLIAKEIAVTKSGEIKNVQTGRDVKDPEIVGSAIHQPDPLAKTNGKRFIPVPVDEVRKQFQQTELADMKSSQSFSSTRHGEDSKDSQLNSNEYSRHSQFFDGAKESVKQTYAVALQNNQYGAHWGSMNNTPAFFEADGSLFAQQAKGIIDVSEWQGDIDWQSVKNAGVEGAIIRVGFGWDNRMDYKAQRNIDECKRLGIPFGVYWFSYALNDITAAAEGRSTVDLLRQAGVKPDDLTYPIYYDLEFWAIKNGSTSPTSPLVYDGIVNNWFSQLMTAGYGNLSTYSYTSYLYSALNSKNIHEKTSWVASYGPRTGFKYPANQRCWQYADDGYIPGIGTAVDLNAMGNLNYVDDISLLWVMRDEDVAVGAAVNSRHNQLEYQWQSYNLDTHIWETIADWNTANWAGWQSNVGDYWLHVSIRDAQDHTTIIGSRTICFHYQPGITRITGTYSGWVGKSVLLGVTSNNRKACYHIKIYDYTHKQWIEDFQGQWATWLPYRGVFWIHYEACTSNGYLADTKTYAFGV